MLGFNSMPLLFLRTRVIDSAAVYANFHRIISLVRNTLRSLWWVEARIYSKATIEWPPQAKRAACVWSGREERSAGIGRLDEISRERSWSKRCFRQPLGPLATGITSEQIPLFYCP